MTDLLLTTNPGLEGIVIQECALRLADAGLAPAHYDPSPRQLQGHVLLRHGAPLASLWPMAYRLRSVHHVHNPLFDFELPAAAPLDEVAAQLRRRDIPALRRAASFRVTTKRYGDHAFTSVDVQRAAGAALVDRYGCRVDLEDYDLDVRVDIFQQSCVVALQLTRQSLCNRYHRVYTPRPALRANVAYAMLHLAAIQPAAGPVLDPFCGTGSLPIEAAQVYAGLSLYASDRSPKAVAGTRLNVAAAGLPPDALHLKEADATCLDQEYPDQRFQAIVADPPYGVRQGRKLNFYWLYYRFLKSAHAVLAPDGRLVCLVWKRGVFNRVLDDLGLYRVHQVLAVETGSIYPRLYLLRPQ